MSPTCRVYAPSQSISPSMSAIDIVAGFLSESGSFAPWYWRRTSSVTNESKYWSIPPFSRSAWMDFQEFVVFIPRRMRLLRLWLRPSPPSFHIRSISSFMPV